MKKKKRGCNVVGLVGVVVMQWTFGGREDRVYSDMAPKADTARAIPVMRNAGVEGLTVKEELEYSSSERLQLSEDMNFSPRRLPRDMYLQNRHQPINRVHPR
jgi:hypothetical protein